MTPEQLRATITAAGNDGLWRTNPVLCLTRWLDGRPPTSDFAQLLRTLADQGISVPAQAVEGWARDGLPSAESYLGEGTAPGVLGLAVEREGYVVPLTPQFSNGWRVDGTLPFRPEYVQDGLASLVRESGLPAGAFVPERFAFTFGNPLCRPIHGDSMTVAATLAVVQQMGGEPTPLFRAAVAVVQFGPAGALDPVSDIERKLAAAYRECGRLSLAVVPPGVTVDRRRVEVVWEVRSVAELGRRLQTAGLLTPLLAARGGLNRGEAARVLDRVRHLVRHDHRYREAADLADRAQACGFAEPVDAGTRVEFARLHAEACRHHGRFADAVRASRSAWESVVALGDGGCDDDDAAAATEYAAGLFSGHRFADIPVLLGPWSDRAADEPRRFRPLTRIKVWNTLARGLVVLRPDGWEALFERSLCLCRRLGDRENVHRTTHYLAHALIRWRRSADARRVLEMLGDQFPRPGDPWDAFLRAKLAAVENDLWHDAELDRKLLPGVAPYPAWAYTQAVARQRGRGLPEVAARLDTAARLLRHDAGGERGNVCHLFAGFLELFAAARTDDTARWKCAADETRAFLTAAADHHAHYADAVQHLADAPDMPVAERVIDRVPYF